jgi:hypothetical protein
MRKNRMNSKRKAAISFQADPAPYPLKPGVKPKLAELKNSR